jgi:DNA-binding transcriptional LysR family regulator
LEADLRIKLLNPTTRRVVVTPDGAAYDERLVRVLDEFDDLMTAWRPPSQVRPGAGGSRWAERSLSKKVIPALPGLQERYSDIRSELSISNCQVDLTSESVGCIVRACTLPTPLLIARHLADMVSVTCAPPSYIERHGRPVHVREAVAAGKLVTRLYDSVAAPRSLYLAYAPNQYVSARLRTFINWSADISARSDLDRR